MPSARMRITLFAFERFLVGSGGSAESGGRDRPNEFADEFADKFDKPVESIEFDDSDSVITEPLVRTFRMAR